jgi:hypothetical protein
VGEAGGVVDPLGPRDHGDRTSIRFLGPGVLGLLAVVLLLGGLALVSAAAPSTSGPPEE